MKAKIKPGWITIEVAIPAGNGFTEEQTRTIWEKVDASEVETWIKAMRETIGIRINQVIDENNKRP